MVRNFPSRVPACVGLFSLGAVVALGYFLLRSRVPMVWDDSSSLCAMRYDSDYEHFSEMPSPWLGLLRESFRVPIAAGYRPLTVLQHNLGRWLVVEQGADPAYWYAWGGGILGLLAVAYYLVARRFTATAGGALLADFLLLFSMPVITGAWPVVLNTQAIVPLTICTGLLLYWRRTEAKHGRSGYTAALGAILFCGPWLREFIGILPLLILWLEVRRARRLTGLMVLAGLTFLHALFPTALVKWAFFSELPLRPVFALGNLHTVLQGNADGGLLEILRRLRWDMPYHFLSLYPPCLLLLTGLGAAALTLRRGGAPLPTRTPALLAGMFLLVAMGLFFAKSALLGLWLGCGLCLLAFWLNSFLAFWFALSFFPFLKVFTEQVHLAYALLPASIVVAVTVERLLERSPADFGWPRLCRIMASGVLLLALADHGLNLYASFRSVVAMSTAVTTMAHWFQAETPAGSAVVCNALHLEDIRLASANHVTSYWTLAAGIPSADRGLTREEDLAKLIRSRAGGAEVYFLDVEFNYLTQKAGYHKHRYVHNPLFHLEPLGCVHVLCCRFPYLDPLKRFAARKYISFPGPPDLENDYYCGPAQDRTPFLREVYAEYHVYRVLGAGDDPAAARPRPARN
jgi:hypothetical protein